MSGQCCSLVVLCLGGIATLSAMGLVAIGVFTDHWTLTTVNRSAVQEHGFANKTELQYFTRTTGLFRVCFPEKTRPPEGTPDLFLSLVDDWCYARDYKHMDILSGVWAPPALSKPGVIQLQLMRVTPALLFLYIFSMVSVGTLGLCGCWQQSANKLIITAALQLITALFGACAMATWHAALFFEMEKVYDDDFPLTWPDWLQQATTVRTSWSYIVCWCGVCLTLLASLATSASAICLRSQRRIWEDNALRMKLKMSSLFAQHAYFPPDSRSSLSGYSDQPRDYPTMPANYPTRQLPYSSRYADSDEMVPGRIQDYRKVLHQMENKF